MYNSRCCQVFGLVELYNNDGGHAGNCEAVNYLLDRQVASVSERNTKGKLPIHLLCDAANERRGLRDTPLYVETIWRLLLANPETVVNW